MSKENRSAREMLEKWKDIKGYEGLYQVSNTGKIKALQRFHKTSNYSSIGYIAKEKIKTVFYSKQDSYGRVGLNKNGKTTRKYIHRLVAEAFIPNPYNLPEVNHKDENKKNNCVENLEWCSRKYNNNYGKRNKQVSIKNTKKRKIYQYDLSNNLIKIWNSIPEIKLAGFKTGHIGCCLKGKRQSANGYLWKGDTNV